MKVPINVPMMLPAPPLSLRVAQTDRHAHHRLVGNLDAPVFDIEIHGAEIDFPGGELQALLEIVTVALILQQLIGNDRRLACHVVDAGPLPAVFPQPAHLVVTEIAADQRGEGLHHRAGVRILFAVDGLDYS